LSFLPSPQRRYLAFNKPFEVITQFSEAADKVTLAAFGFPGDVYPVGRLDYDSEGLLILSNDGRLTKILLEGGHARTYLVQVEGEPTDEQLDELSSGVWIDGKRTKEAEVYAISGEPALPERSKPIRFRKNIPTSWLELTIFEGRNRQVRKMTAAVGLPTLRLARIAIGSLNLFSLGLKPSQWCELGEEDVLKLFD
jgi:23S rRNA pseudouridine2457 synthase